MISLLFKKNCVFALVWIEKATAVQISPLTKKLTEVVISVKLYSIILSLPITTSRKMFGYFETSSKKKRYEKLIVVSPYYIALHDYFYKNILNKMYDYQNAASHAMNLKDVTCNFTLWEMSEFMFDEHSSVFKDTTLYERLDNKS